MFVRTINEVWRDRLGLATRAVTPLLFLPTMAIVLLISAPSWQLMWGLAFSIYAGLKWLTFVTCPTAHCSSLGRIVGYLVFWPGMNARDFCDSTMPATSPPLREWLLAVAKVMLGVALLFVSATELVATSPLVSGWIGMIGLIFVLHFGLFHVLSLCWRTQGIYAEPIMNWPILACSLSDFWGRRWNLAFRDVAFGHLFRPFARRIGAAEATMLVFIVSGLVHEAVISFPVGAGWRGPTAYFTVQGAGLLFERSGFGQSLGLGKGFRGRFFCGLLTAGPAALLFHETFVRCAILPTIAALRAI